MRISDWSSDVCSSDLGVRGFRLFEQHQRRDADQRVEQEVRIELVAQHRELRRSRLRLEPQHAVILFLELEAIVDREIERRPGAERGRVDIAAAQQQPGKTQLARPILYL